MKKLWCKIKCSEISILEIFNFFIALSSFVVAVIALVNSKQIELDVADYEFTLSQTPKLCILNQEFQIPIHIESDRSFFETIKEDNGNDNIYDLIEFFPIKIPVYNIGMGLAQNCKIEINCKSQKSLVLNCRDIFKSCGLIEDLYYGDISPEYRYEFFLFDYEYVFDDENLIMVKWKSDFFTEVSNDFSKDYKYNYPYILPISNDQSDLYFEIPEEFSAFIFEALYQEIIDAYNSSFIPIELEVIVKYQDLKNNEYCNKYLLKFNIIPNDTFEVESIFQIGLEVEEITEK